MAGSGPTRDYARFEVQCGELLTALNLGFPIHLASGPDRGKDFVLSASLSDSRRKHYRISVECKFRRTSSIGPDALFSKDLWARADKVDILLIITNTKLSAGAVDWIRQTEADRPFPIVVWAGEYLAHLRKQVRQLKSEPSRLANFAGSIHAELANSVDSHLHLKASPFFDPRLETPWLRAKLQETQHFVNRHEEIEALVQFDLYHFAVLSGPIGIGKSTLAREVLRNAQRQGFTPLLLESSTLETSPLRKWLVQTAATLRGELSKSQLADVIRLYGLSNIQQLTEYAVDLIKASTLYIVIEDVHRLRDETDCVAFLDILCRDLGSSRVLVTSRNEIPWSSWLNGSHIKLDLTGFDQKAIIEYFESRSLDCPPKVVEILAAKQQGWPLLVAAIGCQLALGRSRTRRVRDLLNSAREAVGPTLATGVLSTLSADAQLLLSFLIHLRTPLTTSDLTVVTGLDGRRFSEAWEELGHEGLLSTSIEPMNCIHNLVKSSLRNRIGPLPSVHRELGLFLRYSTDNPDRVLAATEHFLEIPEPHEAAKTLIVGGETLVRCGLPKTLLHVSGRIDSCDIPESLFLSLVLVRVGAFEVMGRFPEAQSALLTFFYEGALRSLDYRVVAQYHYRFARLSYYSGEYSHTRLQCQKALETLDGGAGPREREAFLLRARCLALLARLHYIARAIDEAESTYTKALAIYSDLNDQLGMNQVRHRLAMIADYRGHEQQAYAAFKAVEREARRHRDAKRLSYALHRIGLIEGRRGNLEQANIHFKESITIKKRLGHTRGLIYTGIELVELALRNAQLDQAEEQAKDLLLLTASIQLPKEEALVLRTMGRLRFSQGRISEGTNWFQKSILQFEHLGLSARASALRLELEQRQRDKASN